MCAAGGAPNPVIDTAVTRDTTPTQAFFFPPQLCYTPDGRNGAQPRARRARAGHNPCLSGAVVEIDTALRVVRSPQDSLRKVVDVAGAVVVRPTVLLQEGGPDNLQANGGAEQERGEMNKFRVLGCASSFLWGAVMYTRGELPASVARCVRSPQRRGREGAAV